MWTANSRERATIPNAMSVPGRVAPLKSGVFRVTLRGSSRWGRRGRGDQVGEAGAVQEPAPVARDAESKPLDSTADAVIDVMIPMATETIVAVADTTVAFATALISATIPRHASRYGYEP